MAYFFIRSGTAMAKEAGGHKVSLCIRQLYIKRKQIVNLMFVAIPNPRGGYLHFFLAFALNSQKESKTSKIEEWRTALKKTARICAV